MPAICDDFCVGGVLIVDKPAGMTSHDVVGRMRRLFHTRQVGHTGTLDPLATGVLPVLIGRAVKASEYVMAEQKRYFAGIRFGFTTDTEDITGTVQTRTDRIPSRAEIEAILPQFTGKIAQIPPMYSALKIGGQKLVDLARQGISVERNARQIQIERITLCDSPDPTNDFCLDVICSKGTYIRTLCADIGAALGCGAVMSALRRTASGQFTEAQAITPDALEEMDEAARKTRLQPVESLFADLPKVVLPPFFARLGHCGALLYQAKLRTAYPCGTRVRLADAEGFFALGEAVEDAQGAAIKPIKQFVL